MAIQLDLGPELEAAMRREAVRRGLPLEMFIAKAALQQVPEVEQQTAIATMLQRWNEENANLSDEEAAANEDVLRAIDSHRPEGQKLFADLLNGTRP